MLEVTLKFQQPTLLELPKFKTALEYRDSDTFTIYQLTHTIIYDLPKRIQLYKPKVVVISGLLDQFLQDPYLSSSRSRKFSIANSYGLAQN